MLGCSHGESSSCVGELIRRQIYSRLDRTALPVTGSPGEYDVGVRKGIAVLLFTGVLLAPTGASARWHPHFRAAVSYARGRSTSFSIAVRDQQGRWYRHRSRKMRPAASVFKVMLLVTYLRMSRHRDLRHHDKELLGPMIKWSCSSCASRVRDIVGHRRIRRLARKAHMARFRLARPWGLSQITAADQADFMYKLERYIPERHEGYARYLLSHIVPSQRWGIGRLDLGRWRLFFKSGWATGTGQVSHQVAWIERGDKRISMAVLTENSPNHQYSIRTLRGIFRRLLRGLPGR